MNRPARTRPPHAVGLPGPLRSLGPMRLISLALLGLVGLVFAGWLIGGGDGVSTAPPPPQTVPTSTGVGIPVRGVSELPAEAAQVWQAINAGGPFRYGQDGAVFDNREGRLPLREPGCYEEYTVPTPGEKDRGARRLIAGCGGELYYTGDHYASFVAVDPDR